MVMSTLNTCIGPLAIVLYTVCLELEKSLSVNGHMLLTWLTKKLTDDLDSSKTVSLT